MRERDIETALNQAVTRRGGRSYKWSSPAHRGVPDRIVFLPGGVSALVEVKAPGKKPTALQNRTHAELRGLGQHVVVLDDVTAIEGALDGIPG